MAAGEDTAATAEERLRITDPLLRLLFARFLPAAASAEELPSVMTLRTTPLPLGVRASIPTMGVLDDLAGPACAACAVTVLVTSATDSESSPGRPALVRRRRNRPDAHR